MATKKTAGKKVAAKATTAKGVRPPKEVWIVYEKLTGDPLDVERKRAEAKVSSTGMSTVGIAGPYVLAERARAR